MKKQNSASGERTRGEGDGRTPRIDQPGGAPPGVNKGDSSKFFLKTRKPGRKSMPPPSSPKRRVKGQ